jgi:hypothetical protein
VLVSNTCSIYASRALPPAAPSPSPTALSLTPLSLAPLSLAPATRGFAFYRPDGTLLPASPALPHPEGTIGDCHDADITPDTIIPPWYGERLNLDHAIYICFANAGPNSNAKPIGTRPASPQPGIASGSSDRKAGPTGYASTTPSTPPPERWQS